MAATAFFGGAFFGGEFFSIAAVTDTATGGPSRRHKKRRNVITFAEFETKQQRIEAMARAMALNAAPLSQPVAQIEEEIEDDEAILLAAIRTVIH